MTLRDQRLDGKQDARRRDTPRYKTAEAAVQHFAAAVTNVLHNLEQAAAIALLTTHDPRLYNKARIADTRGSKTGEGAIGGRTANAAFSATKEAIKPKLGGDDADAEHIRVPAPPQAGDAAGVGDSVRDGAAAQNDGRLEELEGRVGDLGGHGCDDVGDEGGADAVGAEGVEACAGRGLCCEKGGEAEERREEGHVGADEEGAGSAGL